MADENWGSFVHLTVDGQNNVIFLEDGQVVETAGEATDAGTATVLIEEPLAQPAPPATRQRTPPTKAKVTRRSTAAAAAAAASAAGGDISSQAATSSSTGEVDLLSFVQSAGVMVQHILDIQSDNA